MYVCCFLVAEFLGDVSLKTEVWVLVYSAGNYAKSFFKEGREYLHRGIGDHSQIGVVCEAEDCTCLCVGYFFCYFKV